MQYYFPPTNIWYRLIKLLWKLISLIWWQTVETCDVSLHRIFNTNGIFSGKGGVTKNGLINQKIGCKCKVVYIKKKNKKSMKGVDNKNSQCRNTFHSPILFYLYFIVILCVCVSQFNLSKSNDKPWMLCCSYPGNPIKAHSFVMLL